MSVAMWVKSPNLSQVPTKPIRDNWFFSLDTVIVACRVHIVDTKMAVSGALANVTTFGGDTLVPTGLGNDAPQFSLIGRFSSNPTKTSMEPTTVGASLFGLHGLIRIMHPLPYSSFNLFSLIHNRSGNQEMGSVSTLNPLFRSEAFGYYLHPEQNNTMLEKRQLFLRSYQFCRKKSLTERIKGSLVRAKKIVWLRLRSARKLRRSLIFFSRFKCAFYYRRRRFFQLLHTTNCQTESSSCFCPMNMYTMFSGEEFEMLGRLWCGKAARAKGYGGGPFVCSRERWELGRGM
ncbi:hypothetical protein VNO78_20580 [Psophocarpus tetragonolobus]|uniref:Uncharacterized protein n=1 Tax=Psophocarpus tetragonolobus TaxID=3891 RepID=A0AAN9SBN5_PSOTE